jgi:hypothetical protein
MSKCSTKSVFRVLTRVIDMEFSVTKPYLVPIENSKDYCGYKI